MEKKKKKKKKWSDTWWGALWALAIIDGGPGRSVRTFMEVDEALHDLDVKGERVVFSSLHANAKNTNNPCPKDSSAPCEI
jgi:hypothetical protein